MQNQMLLRFIAFLILGMIYCVRSANTVAPMRFLLKCQYYPHPPKNSLSPLYTSINNSPFKALRQLSPCYFAIHSYGPQLLPA